MAVCFGHQLLAQAMGGRVAKSPDGWGAGVHAYELLRTGEPWMVPPSDGPLRIIASHQDQVVELPDGAVLLARTDHCPVAAYTLGPAALAIQPHPEFTAGGVRRAGRAAPRAASAPAPPTPRWPPRPAAGPGAGGQLDGGVLARSRRTPLVGCRHTCLEERP